jgi:uncharacterized protein YjlB
MEVSIPDDFVDVVREPDLLTRTLPDDGPYPNNDTLPVLVYGQALRASTRSLARTVERLFRANGWTGAWRNGVFAYHHYHSTAHEVLGVTGGTATLQLGGPDGWTLDVEAGDVLVLPAGVAHKNLGSDADFQVVGAYPDSCPDWDLKRGRPGDRPAADRTVEEVPLPSSDPVYGGDGPLFAYWKPDK